MVTIQTDDQSPPIKIAKSLLCQSSEYFVRALDGGFKESTEHRLTLPGCDYQTAKIFAYWIHQKELPNFCKGCGDRKNEEWDHGQMMSLARLWMLGDQVLTPKLQNAAAKQLLEVFNIAHITPEILRDVCSIAPKGSKLRLLFLTEAHFDHFQDKRISREALDGLTDVPWFWVDFL